MERYHELTKAYLGILQSSLSQEEFERSKKAGEEMYEAISQISKKHKLSIREMLNTTLAIHETILETINEQIENQKKGVTFNDI